jgi:tetratricopeptide (TPR) repeat protein
VPGPAELPDSCTFKRRAILRKLVLWWLLLVPFAGFAATGDEFYERLYQRGMTHFAAGDYATAFAELRNAAFGFVDHVDKFETIQAYASVAAHRLGHDNDARESLMRIAAAEKVQQHFALVTLPDDLRNEVNKLAAMLLPAQEAALFNVPTDAAKTKPSVIEPPRQTTPKSQPVTPPPQPVTPTPSPLPRKTPKPETPARQPSRPVPHPRPTPKREIVPQPAGRNVDSRLAEAQNAIDNGEIDQARSIYRALLSGPALPHSSALLLVEGMYRVHDFAGAASAFKRAGTLDRGEERYHYYYAVALYETARYGDAKRELNAALPFIALTADVARYRVKIEGAIE